MLRSCGEDTGAAAGGGATRVYDPAMTTEAAPERSIPLITSGHPRREEYLRWAMELTALPTAAGREGRPAAWIKEWSEARDDVAVRTDEHFNIELRFAGVDADGAGARPICFTAHLDHPAFVVSSVGSPTDALLEFRGGVMEPYFQDARVTVHAGERAVGGTLTGRVYDPRGDKDAGNPGPIPEGEKGEVPDGASGVFPVYACELDEPAGASVGEVATWELPAPEIVDDEFGGILHTHACDDLAAAAAALGAFEELRLARARGVAVGDVRLLFTPRRGDRVRRRHRRVQGRVHARRLARHRARELAQLPRGLPDPRRPDRPRR